MRRPVIYLGHGLTHASAEFAAEMASLRESLRERYEILDFLGFDLGTARDVYEFDSGCVKKCDAFVAECTHASLGVGVELQIAGTADKPTLILHKRGIRVSRMVLGIPNPRQEVEDYETPREALEAIEAFMSRHVAAGSTGPERS
jgi:hypothetical protein